MKIIRINVDSNGWKVFIKIFEVKDYQKLIRIIKKLMLKRNIRLEKFLARAGRIEGSERNWKDRIYNGISFTYIPKGKMISVVGNKEINGGEFLSLLMGN